MRPDVCGPERGGPQPDYTTGQASMISPVKV